ncbi:aspartyl protease family protein [Tundrisphaera sp. TA3]|uniref:retropepsin-like aspartic protease n=1 Tax=Tundrisphaera sp. TA3 TaxID=3435775 RepID=UPI003EC06D9B
MGLFFLFAGLAPAPPQDALKAPASVPFELVASNHIVVRAKINGKGPYRLVFDLGAPVTLLGNRAAEESGAIAKDAPKSFLMAMRGEGDIKSMEVGDLTASDIPVVVLDHPTLKALGGFLGRPLDGIMGYTFFARYRTTIDYQSKTMSFAPVDHEVRNLIKELPDRLAGPKVAKDRILAPAGLWGLALGDPAADGSGVAIRSVRAGSAAEAAGLKAGDLLTTIDGRWTTSVADVFAAAGGVAAGRDAEVVALRDGQEVRLTVRPVGGI